jgi:TM2 domain-containing membrane protein YozV
MLIRLLTIVLALLLPILGCAAGPFEDTRNMVEADLLDWRPEEVQQPENQRLVASILAITLGPFGGHRIYFGTKPIVPIIYVATLGGGFFILPLIDLGHILFTKDLSVYENHSGVFMWRKKSETTPQ